MSESVKQEVPAKIDRWEPHNFGHAVGMKGDDNGEFVYAWQYDELLSESAALREEIKNATLLSDSQLANQERLTEELTRMKEEMVDVRGSRDSFEDTFFSTSHKIKELCAELATERANQERLVGEMQELRQALEITHKCLTNPMEQEQIKAVAYLIEDRLRPKPDKPDDDGGSRYWFGHVRALVALAKDTPTEPKSAPEEQP